MKQLSIALALTSIFIANTAFAERSGKEIYEKHCHVCHSAGVANAPKFAEPGAWDERAKKGEDALLKSVKGGLNAMPPMGTCMDCTDGEFKASIKYMIDASEKK